jgi:hypothetical protein
MDHKAKRSAYRERAAHLAQGKTLAERNKELTAFGGAEGRAVYTGVRSAVATKAESYTAWEQQAPNLGRSGADGYLRWLSGR